ncbi:MAG: STAS domain-containing protein [Saprospiraceae bacterium]|nr:STAS domain-containing protein [Saprospiraceae bacterium]
MKYQIDKQGHFAVLTLNEDNLNSVLAPNLKSDLIFLSQEGLKGLVLDLSNVKYVDSSGLSAILTGYRLWKDEAGFYIAGQLHPMVIKLIEISRLESILSIVPSVEVAVEQLKKAEVA